MHKFIFALIATAIGATTLFAAPADDFYDSAFRSGVAAFESQNYDLAMDRLRMAAFGYLEDIARYETAQSYIAVAAQRMHRTDEARSALRRVVTAERIERRFASLQLTPALRSATEATIKELLPPQQVAWLTSPPAEAQIAAPTPTPPPSPKP